MIKVKQFPVNAFREVTYVVGKPKGKCIIIDAGANSDDELERIGLYIEKEEMTPAMIINTHGHVDHILGVNRLKAKYKIPFAIDSREAKILAGGLQSAVMFGLNAPFDLTPSIDLDLKEHPKLDFGDFKIDTIFTPGHTPGGVSLFIADEKILFTGDTLFKGSIGRTDLPGGDYDVLRDSIINKILPLGGDVTIYPGHGDHSTIGIEMKTNPFVTEMIDPDSYQRY